MWCWFGLIWRNRSDNFPVHLILEAFSFPHKGSLEVAKCAIVSFSLVSGTKPKFPTQISYHHGNTEKLSAVYCSE